MDWLVELFTEQSVAHAVMILSLVIALGVSLGHVRVFGISLGIAGVLFSGLLFGHLGLDIDEAVLSFCREFGLVLFVYTIGMQVGPGFFSSFRKQGLRLNLLAMVVVLGGVVIAVLFYHVLRVPVPVVVGLLSGAVTNTPGLGAAQQALSERLAVGSPELTLPGMAYAVAYPFGVLGVILSMLAIRLIFRIDPNKEAVAYEEQDGAKAPPQENYNFEISNARMAGVPVHTLAKTVNADFVISRLLRDGEVQIPDTELTLRVGDVVHVVCTAESAEKLALVLGDVSQVDVRAVPSVLTVRNVLITQRSVVGKTIRELGLKRRYGVVITRINRAGTELVAKAGLALQFGDRITVIGGESELKKVSIELGDSIKQLSYPNIMPVFIGIILGVLLGSFPFRVPGVPVPVKLGLAGGPLLVSILLSRYARVGPVVWYLPLSANLVLREVGITLFLACVGLKSGGRFVETLVAGDGLYWMALAAVITVVPLLAVGVWARVVSKLNYMTICGLFAGSMTDPPALGFANQMAASDAPSITYASVYAMTMFLRILTAQLLVLILL